MVTDTVANHDKIQKVSIKVDDVIEEIVIIPWDGPERIDQISGYADCTHHELCCFIDQNRGAACPGKRFFIRKNEDQKHICLESLFCSEIQPSSEKVVNNRVFIRGSRKLTRIDCNEFADDLYLVMKISKDTPEF